MTPTLGYWARKILHLFINGGIAVAALLVTPALVKPLTVAGFIAVLMFESIRLKTEAKKLVQDAVGPLFKSEEAIEYSGLFWAAVGALIIALFAQPLAISYGFAILAVCDSMASVVGKLAARRPFFRNKTLPGSIACFIGAFAVTSAYGYFLGLALPMVPLALGAAGIITLVEVFSFPFDDNFTVIITASFLLHGVLMYV
jgi:acyl phosphate:glycerol-3-phosphate acyltransferase